MSIFDEIEATTPGHICFCPLCRRTDTKREQCSGAGLQFYCPDCGRYVISEFAFSEKFAFDNLNNSEKIRLMLAKQLQFRKDKSVIVCIGSIALQNGVINFERK